MAINYARMRALAKRLIEGAGREVSLFVSGATLYDAAKPWLGSATPYTEGSPTEVKATAVFLDPASAAEFGFTEYDMRDTSIKRGEKICLIAASGLTPADVDVSRYNAIKDGEEIWRVVRSKTLEPGGQKILYTFEVSQ